MKCNGNKWNIYKITHTNSFEITDLKKKKKSEYWTEGPQLYKQPNHDYNYCLQNMGIWKIEITKLFS